MHPNTRGTYKLCKLLHTHSKSGYLFTGSYDQTVKVWDITHGHNSISKILYKGKYIYVMDLVELTLLSICGNYYGYQQPEIVVKVWELRGKGRVNALKDIPNPQQEDI